MSSRRPKHDSGWSDWEWSDEHQCFTQWRKNKKGKIEWQHGQTSQEAQTPENRQSTQPITESPPVAPSDYEYDEGNGKEAAHVEPSQQFASMSLNSSPLSSLAPSSAFQISGDVRSMYNPTAQYNRGNFMNSANASTSSWQASQGRSQNQPPRWQHSGVISTRDQSRTYERNDNRYKKCESRKFKFGKVFKVLWAEPVGANGTIITAREPVNQGASFEKTRRFIIVKSFAGHCICLPILTYGGRGTLKPGVHPEDHAVVYSDKRVGPVLLQGEMLSKSPIRMEPNDDSQKLDPASRVNYAKLYTVEHNVKVFFIGALTRNAQAQLGVDYNAQHPLLEETQPDEGYVVTRPPGQSNGSNSGQHFEDLSTTADRFDETSQQVNTSTSYSLPQDTRPSSGYSGSHDRLSIDGSDGNNEYTYGQGFTQSNYSVQDQYDRPNQAEQSDAERTPRRAASPEQSAGLLPEEETRDFST